MMADTQRLDDLKSSKIYGLTKPISYDEPTAEDIERNVELEKLLVNEGLYESNEDSMLRQDILKHLDQIVKEWVKEITKRREYPDEIVENANAIIFPYGSYLLGVNGPGSDMDTLCVGPSYIDREEDFFITLHDILAKTKEVTQLQSVPGAFVPLMKFKFRGVSVDMLYASVQLLVVPQDLDISDFSVLYDIDEITIRSLNGWRMCHLFGKLVPNNKNYQTTLRCLKYWAKKRGIYSNVTGYLGGVNWAILVAYVCQLYPNALPSMLVSRIFKIYSEWKWPHPVKLCAINTDIKLASPVWNPFVNGGDRRHLMPIITPGYPNINSGFSISESTFRVITKQFQFGKDTMEEIEEKKLDWSSLFEPYRFFEAYSHYLQMDILALNPEDLLTWKSWVMSRYKKLAIMLERDTFGELMCHPQSTEYVDPSREYPHCSIFMGMKRAGSVDRNIRVPLDIVRTINKFKAELQMSVCWKNGVDLTFSQVSRRDLPPFVFTNGGIVVERPSAKRKTGEMMDGVPVKRVRFLESKLQNQQSGVPVEVGTVVERSSAKRKIGETMDAPPEKPVKRACLSVSETQNQQGGIPAEIDIVVEKPANRKNNNEMTPDNRACSLQSKPQNQQGGIPAEFDTVVEKPANRKKNKEMIDAGLETPDNRARSLQSKPQNLLGGIPTEGVTLAERPTKRNNKNEMMDAGLKMPDNQACSLRSKPQNQQGGTPVEVSTVVERSAKRKRSNEMVDVKPEKHEKRARHASLSP